MANKYEQIESKYLPPSTGAKNKYEQIESDPPDLYGPPTNPTNVPAPRDYQAYEVLPEMMNHAPDSLKNFTGGMINSIVNWPQTVQGVGRIVGGAALNMASPEDRAKALQNDPRMQERIDAANAVLQFYKDRYGGGWDSIERTIVEDPFGFAADISTFLAGGAGALRASSRILGKGAGAANALDAAAEATNPINALTLVPEAVGNKTGITPKIQNVTRNALDSFIVPENINPLAGPVKGPPGPSKVARNKAVLELAEDPNALTAQLRSVTPVIPGSRSTAGKSGVEAPRLAAASEIAERLYPEVKRSIDTDANIARLRELEGVGSDHGIAPDQMTRAGLTGSFDPAAATVADLEAAMRAADTHNYGPIDPRIVTADQQLLDLFNRPSGDVVLQIAREIAKEEGRTFPESTPASSTPSSVLGPDGRPVMINTPADFAQYRGEDLIRIKKAYNRLASSRELRAKYAIDDEAARKIANTGREFITWMEDSSRLPEHATAAADHRAWSRLTDRKRAMELFKEVLTGPLEGEDAAIHRAAAFANLLDSPKNAVRGNKAVKGATDFGAYNSWADLLTPQDLARLERVRADLARLADARQQAKDGVLHGQKIHKSGEGVADVTIPNMLNALITTLNAGLRGAKGQIDEKNALAIGKNLVDGPEATADMFDEALFRQAQMDRFYNHLGRVGAIKRFPAGVNMLNAERERKRREP